MAQLHAELQRAVKQLFEMNGWYVIENKKGKSSKHYNSGVKGMADLLVVKPFNQVVWLEIKSPYDIQKPDQKIFESKVVEKWHKYYLIYDILEAKKILEMVNNT